MKTSIFLLPSLLVVALSAWIPPAVAASDTCKNVRITLTNSTPDEIKLKKLEYYDGDKKQWREEATMFGIIDEKQNLEQTKSFTRTRDLEKVNDDLTKLRVTYSHRIGGNKYEPPVTEISPQFTCSDGMNREVILNN
jgi:hypothetical protein